MHPLFEEICAGAVALSDGAWGTQLQQRGVSTGDCPDPWNLNHPDLVAEVPAAYVAAGSQVVLTNTFRANRIALADYHLADQVAEINRSGVEISLRAVAGSRAKVFASLGPSGKMMLTGEVTEDQLYEAFAEQASAQASAGAHAIVIETMADLGEALIALRAAKSTGLPVVVSMVYDSGKDLDRTMMGDTPEKVAAALAEAGADALGANCGQGAAGYLPISRRLVAATDLPIWIKPNAGLPVVEDGKIVYKTTPEQFADVAVQMVEAGVSFLGGCCGTGPDYIRAVAQRLGR